MKAPDRIEDIEKETKKMLEKLEKEVKSIRMTDRLDKKTVSEAMENVHAYISDTKYFLEKKDFTRAFEAIVYAWGILDTLQRCHLIVKK